MARRSEGPRVIEVMRLNINQLDQAIQRQDGGTAKRCIDAFEQMCIGMRQVAAGNGCDVGPSLWLAAGDAPASEPEPPPAVRAPEFAPRDAIPPPAPVPADVEVWMRDMRAGWEQFARETRAALTTPTLPCPAAGWLGRLERREWSWGVLGRLTWAWICCAAALSWRGVRRVFGRKGT